jgi:hypothetical protein
MKIFLAYQSEDRATAESIAFSLRSRGHKVFFDRDDLPAGASYDHQIERAVKDSDIFIFLISPDSVMRGRYILTELTFARQKWPDPNRRVLPVMARKTPLEDVPEYLKAVAILEPTGNIAAETSVAVNKMRPGPKVSPWLIAGSVASVAALVTIAWILVQSARTPRDQPAVLPQTPPGLAPERYTVNMNLQSFGGELRMPIPISENTTVQDLLDTIFTQINNTERITPYTYGEEWILTDENGRLLPQMGTSYARDCLPRSEKRGDYRPIAAVIPPGSNLTALSCKKLTHAQAIDCPELNCSN